MNTTDIAAPISFGIILLAIALTAPAPAWSQVLFLPEEEVSVEAGRINLARNADRSLAQDDTGTLHAVYYQGNSTTTPSSPSRVLYRAWTPSGGWGSELVVDDSYVGAATSGQRVGGREPSIVVDSTGTATVFWHDHRHSSSAGNWIDNIEIYADRKPAGGTFSATDLRITNTNTGALSDNGYSPQAYLAPGGQIEVTWYDFHFDGDNSDLFLLTTAPCAAPSGQPMADTRVTIHSGSRPAYSQPSSVTTGATTHFVWTTGFSTTGDLYYGQKSPWSAPLTETLLATDASSFFDPPHLTRGPDDSVWIAWADKRFGSSEEIYLRRRPAGGPDFLPEIRVTNNSARQYQPDIEIDGDGNVHLAWVDERHGNPEIYYGFLDDTGPAPIVQEQRVTADAGDSTRPCLLVGPEDTVYLMWEDDRSGQKRIYFTRGAPPSSVGGDWRHYR